MNYGLVLIEEDIKKPPRLWKYGYGGEWRRFRFPCYKINEEMFQRVENKKLS